MKKTPVSLICGAATVLITILLYFIILNNVVLEAIHFITLIGVVVAEIITTTFAYCAKGNPRKVAAAIVSAFTIPLAVMLSVVYMVAFPKGYVTYICWYFVSVILVNVIAIILYNFDSKKTQENADFQNAKTNMLNMRKMVKLIMSDPAAEGLKKELEDLEEKLHFSVDNVIAAQDSTIYDMLVELRNNVQNTEYDSKALITKINKAIDERNILCSQNI